jgi:hypothetical protein
MEAPRNTKPFVRNASPGDSRASSLDSTESLTSVTPSTTLNTVTQGSVTQGSGGEKPQGENDQPPEGPDALDNVSARQQGTAQTSLI